MLRRINPRLLVLLGLCLGLLMLSRADPAWARAMGVDVWNIDQLQFELRKTNDYAEDLNNHCDRLMSRFELNQLMLDELIEHRRTLVEVARQMWNENQQISGYRYMIQHRYFGETELQRSAANIIVRVAYLTNEEPERQKKVLARLRQEYEQSFGTPAQLPLLEANEFLPEQSKRADWDPHALLIN